LLDLFDERNERVLRQRWNEIMEFKQRGENIFDVNMKIEHVRTAIGVI